MSRPCITRLVDCTQQALSFRPCGKLTKSQETVILTLDELEAIRLADLEGLYQEQAAEKMKVSRQTFGTIITSAHKKVADFLVNAKQLSIGGGTVKVDNCTFICKECNFTWSMSCDDTSPKQCPHCKGIDFTCLKKNKDGITLNKCWRTL